jgi:hypothetical protein
MCTLTALLALALLAAAYAVAEWVYRLTTDRRGVGRWLAATVRAAIDARRAAKRAANSDRGV